MRAASLSVRSTAPVRSGRACYNQSMRDAEAPALAIPSPLKRATRLLCKPSSAGAIGRKETTMITDAPTREQILDLARRLSPADQAFIVAQLAPAIAEALEAPTPSAGDDAWRRLDQLREEFRAME